MSAISAEMETASEADIEQGTEDLLSKQTAT